jgi:hypothetical protein
VLIFWEISLISEGMGSHPLLSPGVAVDLQTFGEVASCVSDMRQDESTRDAANRLLIDFALRYDAYMYTDQIMKSQVPAIGKFAALNALGEMVGSSWGALSDTERQEIKDWLISYINDPVYPEDLLVKVNRILIKIMVFEYPVSWENFIQNILSEIQLSEIKCRRYFNLFADVIENIWENVDRGVISRSDSGLYVISGAIGKEFAAVSELLGFTLKNSNNPDIIRRVPRTLARIVKWIEIGELLNSEILSDTCKSIIERPDLAIDTIPVVTEMFSQVYIPKEHHSSVQSFFDLIVRGLSHFFESDTNASDPNYKFFLSSLMKGVTSLLVHYFGCLSISETFFQLLDHIVRLTADCDVETFDNCFVRFWNLILERCDILENGPGKERVEAIYPLLLQNYFRKFPSPFFEEVICEEEHRHTVHLTENQMTSNNFFLNYLVRKDRDLAVKMVGEILDEFLNAKDFGGVGRVFCAMSGFMDPGPSPENCQLVIQMLQRAFAACERCAEGKAQAAVGLGVFIGNVSSVLVRFFALVLVIVEKLMDFMTCTDAILQQATVFSLVRFLMTVSHDRIHLRNGEIVEIFNRVFERLPSILDDLPDESISHFFCVMSSITVRSGNFRYEKLLEIVATKVAVWSSQLNELYAFSKLERYLIALRSFHSLPGDFQDYFALYRFISNMASTESDAKVVEWAQRCKKQLIALFSAMAPASYDLFVLFTEDFANSPPEVRSPAALEFIATSLRQDIVFPDEENGVKDLFDRVIFPTEKMLSESYDDFFKFSEAFGGLLCEVLVGRFQVLQKVDKGLVNYVFDTLIRLIKAPGDQTNRLPLHSSVCMIFSGIQTKYSMADANMLLDCFGIPLVEAFLELLAKFPAESDLYEVANSIQTLLGGSCMKSNWKGVLDAFAKFASGYDAENLEELMKYAYDPSASWNFAETLREIMVGLKILTPARSVKIMEDGKREELVKRLEMHYEEVAKEEMACVPEELPPEIKALPLALQNFGI